MSRHGAVSLDKVRIGCQLNNHTLLAIAQRGIGLRWLTCVALCVLQSYRGSNQDPDVLKGGAKGCREGAA